MRQKFEQQFSVDIIPIGLVQIPDYKRDELPPTLQALQYIFVTPELNQEVFAILEDAILGDKKKTGRKGMDLWQILVLGTVRMALDTNYDRLWDFANHHTLVRQIMGVESANGFKESRKIPYNTIYDNVTLLNEDTLERINAVVVKAGHQLFLKKNEKLIVKADTFPLEANVHFPSDLSLLWDAGRKCINIIMNFEKDVCFEGWRKSQFWYRSLKNQFRDLSKTCQSTGKHKKENVKEKATEYLRIARELNDKIGISKETFYAGITLEKSLQRLLQLDYFQSMLIKHIDLVERRLIKGETIPHEDKLFSIFETHVEWLKKGKANNKVEIGHNILIASDQFDFILYHKVVEKQADVELTIPLADKLISGYGETAFKSFSLDKGFWKKENKELLELYFAKVIMPKKGNKNKAEQAEESEKQFKKLRNKHSAVESNINSLEHHGLNRCPDKGKKGFKNYTAMGVLAYNLHRLGILMLLQREKNQEREEKKKDRMRQAA